MVTFFYLKLTNTTIERFGILELRNRVTNRVTRSIVMHDLIFVSGFTNFRSTEKFSVNFKLKGKINKRSVITKSILLVYQPIKIIVGFFILLFLMIYQLLFGISLKVTEQKVLYYWKRRIPIYCIRQKLHSRERQMPYWTWR